MAEDIRMTPERLEQIRNAAGYEFNPGSIGLSVGWELIAEVARCWESLTETERLLREERTRHHSLRWLLGLDSHEGEEPQSEEQSVANLRSLLHRAASGPDTPEAPKLMTPLVAAGVDVNGMPVDCCDEFPECSHVYYAVAARDAALRPDTPSPETAE